MLKQYLNHRMSSRGNGKIHSPFVFDWYNKILNGSKNPVYTDDIERVRLALLQNHSTLSITDLGAGSRNKSSNERTVSEIAKNALKPKKQSALLYRIAMAVEAKHMVEFGTSLGITSAYLSAVPGAKLTTIEGDSAVHNLASTTMKTLKRENVNLINASFEHWLKSEIPTDVDMVFFDGNHTYEATMRYWEYFKSMQGLKVAVWDDIYWSKGMKKAWNEIAGNLEKGVAIDLFYLGIVYPNREQAKELFKFRIP